MDRLRPSETALLIGILSVVLNVLGLSVPLGSISLHASPVDAIFLLLGLSAVVFKRREFTEMVKGNRTYYTLSGLFLFSVLISALLSPNPLTPLKELIQLAGYVWVIPLILTYRPDVPRVYVLSAKAVVIFAAVILVPYFYLFGWVRFNPFNIHANPTGFLFALFTVVLAHYGRTWLAVLSSVVTSFTFSRSALGALFASFLFKGYLEKNRRVLNLSLGILPIVLLFTSPYALRGFVAVRNYIKDVVSVSKAEKQRDYKPPIDVLRGKNYEIVRVLIWEASLKMWKHRPLTGIGLGRYEEEWKVSCETEKLPDRLCTKWVRNVDAHNVFIQVLSETGVLGFVTFILLFAFITARLVGNPLALTVLFMTFLFGLLQPFPLFTRNLAPIVWLLLFHGGVIRWKRE